MSLYAWLCLTALILTGIFLGVFLGTSGDFFWGLLGIFSGDFCGIFWGLLGIFSGDFWGFLGGISGDFFGTFGNLPEYLIWARAGPLDVHMSERFY